MISTGCEMARRNHLFRMRSKGAFGAKELENGAGLSPKSQSSGAAEQSPHPRITSVS